MKRATLWFTAKWGLLLSAWLLSIVITLANSALLSAFGNFGSLLNMPSIPKMQQDTIERQRGTIESQKETIEKQKQKAKKQDAKITKQGAEIDARRDHKTKVDNMIKRNASRSKKRVAAAMARLPAEEIVGLFGALSLPATAGFVAYDIADMCYEINDANELLELIGQPKVGNPVIDKFGEACHEIERNSTYVITAVSEGWSAVVTKTRDGWEVVATNAAGTWAWVKNESATMYDFTIEQISETMMIIRRRLDSGI